MHSSRIKQGSSPSLAFIPTLEISWQHKQAVPETVPEPAVYSPQYYSLKTNDFISPNITYSF